VATLADGASVEVAGSGSARYTLSRQGGVYACTCPAWRNQGRAIDARTCKHLRAYLGADVEDARVGAAPTAAPSGASTPRGRTAAVTKGTAPPVLLAHSWSHDVAPDGWWMSEKLDGIRAYWDGAQFWSRLGNRFAAPAWFTAALPRHPLDGELWMGRKLFQRTTSVVRSGDAGDAWKQLLYVVFDAPASAAPFEERMDELRAALDRHAPPYARWHEHVRCAGVDHLRAELARVEALGGEGLMLRRPGSRYEVGRSSSLLKVKTFHDAEARVVGHAPGAGKHKGRLGALEVELADGTRFSVGTGLSDDERRAPPPIGSVITFRYQELSEDGVPRFPSYVGVRIDAVVAPVKQAAAKAKAKAKTGTGRPASPSTARGSHGSASPAAALGTGTGTASGTGARSGTGTGTGTGTASGTGTGTGTGARSGTGTGTGTGTASGTGTGTGTGTAVRVSTAAPSLTIALAHPAGKFWTIEVRGAQHLIRFGADGTPGQTRLAAFADAAAATADAEKRAAGKRKDGYR
jgi:DNA ligase-1